MDQLIDPELQNYMLGLAGGLALVFVWEGFVALRGRFLQWRLNWRMTRGPELLPHEEAEYEYEIHRFERSEDAPPRRDVIVSMLLELIVAGVCFTVASWIGLKFGLALILCFAALGLFNWIWSTLNKAPSRDGPEFPEEQAITADAAIIPKEALLGIAAACLTVGMIVALALLL